ncbi:hypothetical protein ACVWZM_008651 [Bradyrhizobium sp. USDA 4501]
MSTDSDAIGLAIEPPARWRDRVRTWSASVAYVRATDTLIALATASLP